MDPDQIDVRLHTMISGRVQGVGFRVFVLEHANQLGLTGWVRNTWRGEVEVCAEGAQPAVEALLAFLRSGPRSSFVQDIRVEWQNHTGEFTRFEVRRTE